MAFDAQKFGAAIKAHRVNLEWSQDRLALEAGVTKDTVNRLENARGERAPAERTVRALARALGTTADHLGADDTATMLPPTPTERVARLEAVVGALLDHLGLDPDELSQLGPAPEGPAKHDHFDRAPGDTGGPTPPGPRAKAPARARRSGTR